MTMFDGSEETIYNVTYPLYTTYMKLFGLLLITILVVISTSFVIWVILKNKELRNTNNLLIVNLLITDTICTVIVCCIVASFIIAYILDLDVYHYCDIVVLFIPWLSMGSRMMLLPPAVHRFVCVARPFTHHRVLTKRRIILMIIALWVIPVIILTPMVGDIESRTVYVPSLGSCTVVRNSLSFSYLLTLISFVFSYVSSVLFMTISAVYLHHKIINVRAYIRDLQQSGLAQRKLNKSQRLKELLTEQVKPTIGVFVVGGMDTICSLLIGIILTFVRVYSTPFVQFQTIQTILTPLFLLQSLSHSLSYGLWNKNIRDKMCRCYPKHGRVIVLNRQ